MKLQKVQNRVVIGILLAAAMLVGCQGKIQKQQKRNFPAAPVFDESILEPVDTVLKGFTRHSVRHCLRENHRIFCQLTVDYPDATMLHSQQIEQGIDTLMLRFMREILLNYTLKHTGPWTFNSLSRHAADNFFLSVRHDIPADSVLQSKGMWEVLDLRAYLKTKQYVTYQNTHKYHYLGHSYQNYSHLVSIDLQNGHVIDSDYLLKADSREEVIALLAHYAIHGSLSRKHQKDVCRLLWEEYKDAGYSFWQYAQFGLTANGVLFMLQTVGDDFEEIVCLPVLIPYEALQPHLTQRGKQLVSRTS